MSGVVKPCKFWLGTFSINSTEATVACSSNAMYSSFPFVGTKRALPLLTLGLIETGFRGSDISSRRRVTLQVIATVRRELTQPELDTSVV